MKRIIILILLLTTVCFGANEIRSYFQSGDTLYAVIRDSEGQAWDTTGTAFEAWNDMGDYDIALTDKSGGMYLGDFPACDADFYTIIIYKQAGGNPDDSDLPVMFEEGYWTGTAWLSDTTQLQTIRTNLGYVDTDIQSVLGNQTVISGNVDSILVDTSTTLPALINDANDTIIATISGISIDINDVNFPTAAEIRAEIDANSTQLAAIIADTNEVQTDLHDGGRLDTIFDWIVKALKRLVSIE